MVLGAWLVASSPLRALGNVVPGARLRFSAAYLALAPYCDVMDALTLLSVNQHVALLSTVIAGYALWRWRRHSAGGGWRRGSAPGACGRAAAMLTAIAAIYALGATGPRPMAALALADAQSLAIDFHSHTDASWDGRRGFTADDNRAWHRDAGFDVSYISDHGTISAATGALASNPRRSGDGTIILTAAEVRCEGQHVIVLGATARDTAEDCDPSHSPMATHERPEDADGRVALLAIPGNLANGRPLPAVQGLEIADGAPRALDQMRRDERLLRHVADSAGLARLSGSNNHGWGRTAAAWSVMSIAAWRTMSPESLDVAIRREIVRAPRTAVQVIERRRAVPGASPLELVVTAPVVAWTMLVTLSPAERLAWLCWIWTTWACVAIRRGARAGTTSSASRPSRDRAA